MAGEAVLLLAQIKAAEEIMGEFENYTEFIVKETVGEFDKTRAVMIDGTEVVITLADVVTVEDFTEAAMTFGKILQDKIIARKKAHEEELAKLNK